VARHAFPRRPPGFSEHPVNEGLKFSDVTRYLKKIWHDAIRAAQCRNIMNGEEEGDHGKAVEDYNALLQYQLISTGCALSLCRTSALGLAIQCSSAADF
jgi:hypothetical protein